jgi:hypothetical protein
VAVPVIGNTPFMIFGADVTHPTSFNEADPSIAAVCASVDRSLGRFMSRVLKQVWRRLGLQRAEGDGLGWVLSRTARVGGGRGVCFARDQVATPGCDVLCCGGC